MWGAQCLLEVRRRFLGGSGRPSMLMLVRSAAALATIDLACNSRKNKNGQLCKAINKNGQLCKVNPSRIEVEMPRYTHGVIYIKNHDVRQDGQQPKGDRQGYQSSLGIACRAIVQGFVFLNLARAFLMACGLASLVLVLITLYLLRIFTPGLSCNVHGILTVIHLRRVTATLLTLSCNSQHVCPCCH